jgi:hypothetical protein
MPCEAATRLGEREQQQGHDPDDRPLVDGNVGEPFFGHAGSGVVKRPARVGRFDPVLRMDAQPDAGTDGEDLVGLGLGEEVLLHFGQLGRLPLGEVVHL